jgi:hypothetical protein
VRTDPPNPSPKAKVHVGVFDDVAQADHALAELVGAGIPKEQITVICPTCATEKYREFHRQTPSGSHAAAAAVTGSSIGALLGGLVAVAGVTASGGAALLAAGSLLAGSGGGAVIGGFVGAMMTRGMEPEVADFYDQALLKGQVLVAVEPSDEVTSQQIAVADRIFAADAAEQVELRKT